MLPSIRLVNQVNTINNQANTYAYIRTDAVSEPLETLFWLTLFCNSSTLYHQPYTAPFFGTI